MVGSAQVSKITVVMKRRLEGSACPAFHEETHIGQISTSRLGLDKHPAIGQEVFVRQPLNVRRYDADPLTRSTCLSCLIL